MVFTKEKLEPQVRWLMLERDGYASDAESSSVHHLLGLEPNDRLVVRVKTYRVQTGHVAEGPRVGAPFHHFFVEPLRALAETQERLRIAVRGGHSVRLNFSVHESMPYLPTAGDFPTDTFDRIVLGFRAVLHLQLGEVAS